MSGSGGTVLKEFFVLLGVKVDDDLAKRLDQVEANIKKGLQGATAPAKTTLTELHAGLSLVQQAVAGIFGAFHAVVNESAERATEIQSLASIMGVSTDAAQELSYAAQKTGVDVGDLAELTSELAENIGEAAGGTGESADAFKSLGIKTKDAQGKLRPVSEVLLDIADKMAQTADGTKKTGALMGLFGEQGIQLLPLLNQGSKAIKGYAQEARDLGLVMDAAAIQRGVKFSQSLKTLGAVWDGLKSKVGDALAKPIQDVADAVLNWYKANQKIIEAKIEEGVRILVSVFKALWNVVKAIKWAYDALTKGMEENATTTEKLKAGLIAFGLGIAAVFLLAASPLLLIVAIIGALILLVDDFVVYMEGGDSVIGTLIEKLKAYLSFVWEMFQAWMSGLWEWVQSLWGALLDWVKELWDGLWEWVKGLWNSFGEWLKGLWDGIVEYILSALDRAWAKAKEVAQGVASLLNPTSWVEGSSLVSEPSPQDQESAMRVLQQARDAMNQGLLSRFPAGAQSPEASVSHSISTRSQVFSPSFKIDAGAISVQTEKPEQAAEQVIEKVEEWWNGKLGEAEGWLKGGS